MTFNWLVVPTLAAAIVLFVVGRWSIRRCRTNCGRIVLFFLWLLLGMPGLFVALYYLHLFDDAKWFYQFRSSPFTELTAAGAGLFAGALAELGEKQRLASPASLVVLLCLGVVAPHLKPMVAPIPEELFSDRWEDGVCLQSTPSSCGAASAATVFKALGIEQSERDIARVCFTYLGGTENWYIARAFRRHGLAVTYRIEEALPADLRSPAIAGVSIGGMGHFIAILEISEGGCIIGDPLVGRKVQPINRLTNQYDFTGFFMEIGEKN